jgi:hypothetical protein
LANYTICAQTNDHTDTVDYGPLMDQPR